MPEANQPSLPDSPGERARLVALPGGQGGRHRRPRLPSAVSSFVGRDDELLVNGYLLGEFGILITAAAGIVSTSRPSAAASPSRAASRPRLASVELVRAFVPRYDGPDTSGGQPQVAVEEAGRDHGRRDRRPAGRRA
jgi:hypothetical protein